MKTVVNRTAYMTTTVSILQNTSVQCSTEKAEKFQLNPAEKPIYNILIYSILIHKINIPLEGYGSGLQ